MAASTRPLALQMAKATWIAPEQLVPVAHLLRVVRLQEAHQRQLGQHDVVWQCLAQLTVHTPLVGVNTAVRSSLHSVGSGGRSVRSQPPPCQQPAHSASVARAMIQENSACPWTWSVAAGSPGRQAMTMLAMLSRTPRGPASAETPIQGGSTRNRTGYMSGNQPLGRL